MRAVAAVLLVAAGAFAACSNSCSGHGSCSGNDKCSCYARKDSTRDAENNVIPAWTGPDCSLRTCPYGNAWIDDPVAINTAHRMAECSNAGTCDRSSGQCTCFPGYEGKACARTKCPNDCSGHGTCQSAKQFASDQDEAGQEINNGVDITVTYAGAWDSRKMFGCKCEDGFRGPDCSLIECPSGADPQGGPDGDGFDITGGKVEFRDCSGRGVCSYSTGLCTCFQGAYGEDCSLQSALV